MPAVLTRPSALFLTLVLTGTTARADEIDVSKVPVGVRKAADDAVSAKTALKAVTWTAAERYTEGTVVKFDLEGETADEYGVFITVTAAGVVEDLWEQLDFDTLPAAVKKSFRDTVPGLKEDDADVYKYLSGKNLADVSYELEGEDAKGRYVWLDSSADGTIDEFYTEVTFKDLPKAVQDGVNRLFPKRQSATFYVVHVQGKLTRYDAEVVRMTGAESYVSFTPAGRLVKD